MKVSIDISSGKFDTEHGGTISLDTHNVESDCLVRLSMDPRFGEGIDLNYKEVKRLHDALGILLHGLQ